MDKNRLSLNQQPTSLYKRCFSRLVFLERTLVNEIGALVLKTFNSERLVVSLPHHFL